jgi:hypothetical protein
MNSNTSTVCAVTVAVPFSFAVPFPLPKVDLPCLPLSIPGASPFHHPTLLLSPQLFE